MADAGGWVAWKKRDEIFTSTEVVKRGTYEECVSALIDECRRRMDWESVIGGPQDAVPLAAVRLMRTQRPAKREVIGYRYRWGVRPA